MEDLIVKQKINGKGIEQLKTKDYSKSLFPATDYPAVANNRTDNVGNSKHKRYRAKALKFDGVEIFISTQFFDSDRDAIISWYKKHSG